MQMVTEISVYWGMMHSNIHTLPEFDKEYFFGDGGAYPRANIARYNFNKDHAAHKSGHSGNAMDAHVFNHNESVLLLFYGDVQTARVGWRKQADAWESIEKLCTSGERKWDEYGYEEIHMGAALGPLLAAEELPLLREFHSHTFGGVALRDARVAEE